MGFPYHFVDLNDGELKERRRLLDNYGQFAQLSVLLLPLFYQLSIGIKLLLRRLNPRKRYQPLKDHQSPIPPSSRSSAPSQGGLSMQGLEWWFAQPIAPGWETRGQCLLALVWTAWLLLLIIRDTADDYLHITRRFGIVAASQLPIHYLLSAKGWSPVHYLTRMSHEELNPYHRLLGRILTGLFACHATLYLNFYVQKGILLKRIQDWDVIFGLSAISSASILFTTALAKVRDANYRIFFYVHVILASVLLPILYLHVSHVRIYVLETAAVFAGIIIQRNVTQKSVSASIERVPKTDLLSIKIKLPDSYDTKGLAPGQHIYLGFPSLVKKLVKNPFTIAEVQSQSDTRHLRLVIRFLSGTTAHLDGLASQHQPVPITIEGPYGAAKYFPSLADCDRVLFIAGGVGATFTVPIYQDLKARVRPPACRFVWVLKDKTDLTWAPKSFFENRNGAGTVEVYVTGANAPNAPQTGEATKSRVADAHVERDSVEMQVMDGQNMTGPAATQDQVGLQAEIDFRSGRPDLGSIVDETFEHDPNDRIAVLVCGPGGLGASARREVGRWVSADRDVFWHNEEFGW